MRSISDVINDDRPPAAADVDPGTGPGGREPVGRGLSLAPFRGLRYTATGEQLASELSPPYDVVSSEARERLVAANPTNVVRLILPGPHEAELAAGDPYQGAASLMQDWVQDSTLQLDPEPALYVYEMATEDGSVTRGLLGAIELRDPADGVILPHENTMAGPVSDRLALMAATEANLEPIYLVYDGGGPASQLVAAQDEAQPLVTTTTPDGITHRLWNVSDPATLAEVAADLSHRHALIADGHHRYATYLQLQQDHAGAPGPWDRGLTLLVDTSSYGPQVHPIHRVVTLEWQQVMERSAGVAELGPVSTVEDAMRQLSSQPGFAVVLSDGERAVLLHEHPDNPLSSMLGDASASPLGRLDITVLHRVLVEQIWQLTDDVETVGYAHDVDEALDGARRINGVAVLVRATPVADVAAVAAAGERMPRKSTLFTPKPASGLVLRRFADQD